MGTTYRKIDAVRKACDVLKALANHKEPVSGSEVARLVGMPEGTVMCHLATLEEAGFVTSVGDRYKLGMGVALMWARVKSGLEADRDRIDRDLSSIQISEG